MTAPPRDIRLALLEAMALPFGQATVARRGDVIFVRIAPGATPAVKPEIYEGYRVEYDVLHPVKPL